MKQSKEKIRKVMMLNPGLIQKIQHFIDDDRADSEVEVIKQAISYYHDKIYPNYVFHLTPAAKKKQKELQKEEVIESITDEEHAISIGFLPVEDKEGTRYAFYRTIGHQPRLTPLEGFKDWIAENQHVIEMNNVELRTEPLIVFFNKPWGERFMEQNNLVKPDLPEGEKK
jgi:hypothetical protein